MVKSQKHFKGKKEKNEFWEAIHEIRKVASDRMDSKTRKEFLRKEAEKLGARPKKNPKIPYNIYQGILRKEKELEKKAKEDFQLSRDSNFFNPITKRKSKPKPRNPQPNGPKVGTYKNGTLFIKNSWNR